MEYVRIRPISIPRAIVSCIRCIVIHHQSPIHAIRTTVLCRQLINAMAGMDIPLHGSSFVPGGEVYGPDGVTPYREDEDMDIDG